MTDFLAVLMSETLSVLRLKKLGRKKELHPSSASWASVSCILLCCLQGSMLSIDKHPICMCLSLVYLAPSVWFSVPSHQEYSIDIIFYQSWYDERLRYNDTFETLVLHGNVVRQLWIPDTYFRNSKRTHEYDVTMPNQMALIHKDGKVLYSVRYVKPLVVHLLRLSHSFRKF